MKRYKYYQPNKLDLKDEYGDCTIRVLCKIFEKEWEHPQEGDTIRLKATIKDHSEYKEEKQTVLTRCKLM